MALIFCLCSVQFFATLWITVRQASLSITVSRSSLKPRSIESVMPSSHLILCRPLLPCHQSLFMLPRDNFCSLELLLLMLLSHFSRVRLCVTPYTAAHQASIPGILQARILEWVAISFSRWSSWPWDWTWVSHISRQILYCWATTGKLTKPDVLSQFWKPEARYRGVSRATLSLEALGKDAYLPLPASGMASHPQLRRLHHSSVHFWVHLALPLSDLCPYTAFSSTCFSSLLMKTPVTLD